MWFDRTRAVSTSFDRVVTQFTQVLPRGTRWCFLNVSVLESSMPTVKLTARTVQAARPPKSGRLELFDEDLPGFCIFSPSCLTHLKARSQGRRRARQQHIGCPPLNMKRQLLPRETHDAAGEWAGLKRIAPCTEPKRESALAKERLACDGSVVETVEYEGLRAPRPGARMPQSTERYAREINQRRSKSRSRSASRSSRPWSGRV
jgi:hypothetical protein